MTIAMVGPEAALVNVVGATGATMGLQWAPSTCVPAACAGRSRRSVRDTDALPWRCWP